MAPDEPELSPYELAVTFTNSKGYFISVASVYKLLKAHDLITSLTFVVIKVANEFKDKTTASRQLWQVDFTYFKVIDWSWFFPSTILNDYSRSYMLFRTYSGIKSVFRPPKPMPELFEGLWARARQDDFCIFVP